jgi:integrase
VLIVEDEALVAMDLALVLHDLGCVVLRPAPRASTNSTVRRNFGKRCSGFLAGEAPNIPAHTMQTGLTGASAVLPANRLQDGQPSRCGTKLLPQSRYGKGVVEERQPWRQVTAVMAAADIPAGPHRTSKGLRHGFGVHAIASGVPLNMLSKWMGHASLEVTAIYANALGSEEQGLAARMGT